MYSFDNDTALTRLDAGHYQASLNRNWFFRDAPNGGYILAQSVKAGLTEFPDCHAITASAHYLQAAAEGPADLFVTTLREGKRYVQLQIQLCQHGRCCLQVMLLCARNSEGSDDTPAVDRSSFPAIDPPRRCIAMPVKDPQFRAHVNTLIHPPHFDAMEQGSHSPMHLLAWAEMQDKRPVDPLALLVFADAFPRAMAVRAGLIGWIPTLELTVQLLRTPTPGPVACEFQTQSLANGLLEESGRLWDSDKNLVAVCRQTAAPRIPQERTRFFAGA